MYQCNLKANGRCFQGYVKVKKKKQLFLLNLSIISSKPSIKLNFKNEFHRKMKYSLLFVIIIDLYFTLKH